MKFKIDIKKSSYRTSKNKIFGKNKNIHIKVIAKIKTNKNTFILFFIFFPPYQVIFL